MDGRLILALDGCGVRLADRSTLAGVEPKENPKSTLFTLRALLQYQLASSLSKPGRGKQTPHPAAASGGALVAKEQPC